MTHNITELLDDRLHIYWDMNMDGVVTISDVWLWLKWFYFLPGDLAQLSVLDTPVGNFLEITPWSLEGIGSGVLSAFVWLVIYERFICGKR